MVQEFHVLRCFSCETFQVDQVKKSTNKWTCKVCHSRQSTKQVFFKGSGKECRLRVQDLNSARGKRSLAVAESEIAYSYEKCQNNIVSSYESKPGKESQVAQSIANDKYSTKDEQIGNRWNNFIDETEQDAEADEEVDTSLNLVTTDRKLFEGGRKIQRKKYKAKRSGSKPYSYQQKLQKSKNSWKENLIIHGEQKIKIKGENLARKNNTNLPQTVKENCNSIQTEKAASKWGHFMQVGEDSTSNCSDEEDGPFIMEKSSNWCQ
ncbi:MRN complex-interacting protein-like [Rhopilema esculentum]|uniref:MRN complex-interacting protein-like n=1 Tax=Rhopilema esculentum TaxID=499914 RepID=UPI0031D9CEC9